MVGKVTHSVRGVTKMDNERFNKWALELINQENYSTISELKRTCDKLNMCLN